MTDITELAQSLKRRATYANEFGESLYVKADDILALVEALENSESRLHEVAVACATAEHAMEKAQQRIFELESSTVKLTPCVDDLHGIGMVMSADAVVEALTSYGIKVEAE